MTPEQYIQKLTDLSLKKSDSMKKILILTKKQAEVITEDSIEELQNLIDIKQKLIDDINELDDAFEVYFSRLKSILGIESMEEVRISDYGEMVQLQQTIKTIFQTIKEIQNVENQNNMKARDVLESLGGQIRQVKQGKIANNGYNIGGKLPQQSYYFDTKK
ncbi:FlgN family protein [Ruminiclostridium papyrosolvens DSM 2782]|uniref:FlgN family protein n=1 Tax=Ruminiclostridium papyrosolvens DSM 2782 TaxID=588581 RepID=F1TCQ6_9FIRM|nr:flagellar protein FlgN [Ruminiclostridium papyrosolvens]EGD47773.1 FlgN family protein [Ruminiclostridium papyrosolvens DSM 2782]WES34490.1 flagellar protein FlgN [Ruminiclostridium papyrosolvens DSM 2782]